MRASVVISCYNQILYIKECLDSVLSQQTDFPFEVIVSDDCSTDGTQSVLCHYRKNLKRPDNLKLVLRAKNVGPAANYHGLHALASNDVVFHLDGDDFMLPGKLQQQMEIFRSQPEVNVVFHKAIYFSDDRSYEAETGFPKLDSPPVIYFTLKDIAMWGPISVHSSYAYRRASRTTAYDREFMEWFFAMDSLKDGGIGAYISKPLVMYRSNQNGGSYLSTLPGREKSYKIYFNDVYFYFEKIAELRLELYANYLFTTLTMFVALKKLPLNNVLFLTRNIKLFRISKIVKVFLVRRHVGPCKSINRERVLSE